MAKTKILATLGPASYEKIDDLVNAGLDGFRINMSHTKDYDSAQKLIDDIRERHPEIFITADLEGPKIRLGDLKEKVSLKKDQAIRISPQNDCPASDIPVQLNTLYQYVQPGNILLVNDGAVGLKVSDVKGKTIITQVEYGDMLESRKGVNVPGVHIPLEYFSEKDPQHIEFLKKTGVDYIFASYTLGKEHMLALQEHLKGTGIKSGAKPETQYGMDTFSEMLGEADIVMVPRGDLGMEIGVINVPRYQKSMILDCNMIGKPVITATQMLESMMTGKEPKRSEISDIFNSVLDGTDIVMLSGETSVGQYPVEAVKMMNKTLDEAEKYMFARSNGIDLGARLMQYLEPGNPADDMSRAVYAVVSNDPSIKAIITPTVSGYTPRMISRFRMKTPIIALTNNEQTYRQLSAVWGVTPVYVKIDTEQMQRYAKKLAEARQLVKPGDKAIVTSGLSPDSESTHVMRIENA
jgi:pyruvate kinase